MHEPNRTLPLPSRSRLAWKMVLRIFLVLALVVWIVMSQWADRPMPYRTAVYFFMAILVLFCSLLGFWGGLGRVRWRWLVIVIAGMGLAFASDFVTGGASLFEFSVFCLGIVAVVGVTTTVLRFWKGSLCLVAEDEVSVDALQFGIKDIFIWTTAVAVLFGVGRIYVTYVHDHGLAGGQGEFFLIFGLAASISMANVVNIWALLGQRMTALKIVTLVLVTAGAMACSNFLMPDDWFFGNVTLIAQILMLFVMFTIRKQGFRFVK